jgi:hypothetical protein
MYPSEAVQKGFTLKLFGLGPDLPGSRGMQAFVREREAELLLLSCLSLRTIPSAMAQDVLTYRNDIARTGQDLNETILKPGSVKFFR